MRLLSFLTEIEHALLADDPSPLGGAWGNSRTINYHQGLARLSLGSQQTAAIAAMGSVTLQEFRLADDSSCVKAFLTWSGSDEETIHAIYETPDVRWTVEARRIGAAWLEGREKNSATSSQSLHRSALAKTG